MDQNLLTRSAIVLLLATISAAATTRYVVFNSPAPTPPYTDWSIAATNIQDAVDAADPGDLVLVTNGLYQTGGAIVNVLFTVSITNRVAVTKPLTVQSVNGPAVTTIMGSTLAMPYVRCAFLANGAALVGFTLTNGAVPIGLSERGGGVYAVSSPLTPPSAIVSNCVLTSNSAAFGGGAYGVMLNNCVLAGNSASGGGGAFDCVLNRCVISENTVPSNLGPGVPPVGPAGYGGGAYLCTMNNCLIVGNSASQGGGASGGSLNNCTIVSNTAASSGGVCSNGITALTNCIVFDNSATNNPNYQAGPVFSYCCTTPLPTGTGNITNDPFFLNPSAGDFHLQTNSPCINAGNNFAVANATDLDGNPRIAGGTVDIGAYEFQTPASIISYAWLQWYGLPTDGSADFLDSDGDGMNNWQEWRAGTNPTNPLSVLQISSLSVTGAVATVRWESAAGVTYCLERSTNLAQPNFSPVQSNIAGVAGLSIVNGGRKVRQVAVQ